jgi:hypothetical protein
MARFQIQVLYRGDDGYGEHGCACVHATQSESRRCLTRVPSISLLIPTAGRWELECALSSVVLQLAPEDEVIVIGDTLDDPLLHSQAIVASFGPQFRWIEYPDVEHTFGHAQLNAGIAVARGDVIHCNDDDDIWADDALISMRRAATQFPGRPLLFRFISRHHLTAFWDRYGVLAQDHVGGHCLVAPNIPGKMGVWGRHYQGDFEYVLDTVTRQGGVENVIWRDELIAVARPGAEHRQLVMEIAGRWPALSVQAA